MCGSRPNSFVSMAYKLGQQGVFFNRRSQTQRAVIRRDRRRTFDTAFLFPGTLISCEEGNKSLEARASSVYENQYIASSGTGCLALHLDFASCSKLVPKFEYTIFTTTLVCPFPSSKHTYSIHSVSPYCGIYL